MSLPDRIHLQSSLLVLRSSATVQHIADKLSYPVSVYTLYSFVRPSLNFTGQPEDVKLAAENAHQEKMI